MACAIRLTCLSLPLWTGHGQGSQPLGLGLGPGPLTARGRVRRVCVQCEAHAQQSVEVSASDSARKGASSSEPYAGWDTLDSKSETDYWTGVLQIGAGLALALGFSLVTHTAYGRRGGGGGVREAVDPAAAVAQAVLLEVDAGAAVEHDSPGFVGVGKERKQAEAVAVAEPAAGQGPDGHAVAVDDAEDRDKFQQKAVPGQVSYPHEEVAEWHGDGAVVSAAPLPYDTELGLGQDSIPENVAPDEGSEPSDVVEGHGADTLLLSAEEGQPPASNQGEGAVPSSSQSEQSAASEGLSEEFSVLTQEVVITAVPATGSTVLESGNVVQNLALESVAISSAAAASARLPSDPGLDDFCVESSLVSSGDFDPSPPPSTTNGMGQPGFLEEATATRVASVPLSSPSSTGVVESSSSPLDETSQDLATTSWIPMSIEAVNLAGLVLSEAVAASSQVEPIVPPALATEPTVSLGVPAEPDEHISVPGEVTAAEPYPLNTKSLHSDSVRFGSFGIPAPSTPSTAARVSPGKVVIPAVVDQVQEQALAVLQALKVIETGVEGGNICTRREYARWLINASNILAKSSSRKVFPAMYIQNVTELAFDDVTPEDPDFPSIQGLAEAGLIASRLSQEDLEGAEDGGVYFAPDDPLSRQDLLSWKLSLDGGLQKVDRQSLQTKSGFIDIDRIHEDAWPAVFADLSAGEDSIIATAFGYTRRFHPSKPTTKGQAAVALVLGEASALVADESARLQAEKIAEQAVRAEVEMEARVFQEVDAALKEMVELERQGKVQALSLAETLQSQLESLKLDREQEKYSVLREQALVDAEKEVIAEYRRELEQELQALAALRVELSFEKDRAGKSWVAVEQEREAVENLKNQLDVEKQALMLARQWAEQEARNARTHSKVLEEARKRWESQGIEVTVDDKLAEENIPEQTWTYSEMIIGVESEQTASATVDTGDRNFVQQVRDGVVDFVNASRARLLDLIRRVVQALRNILAKLRADVSHSISQLADATDKGRQGVLSLASVKAQELHRGATSAATGVSTCVSQGTRKLAYGLKQEAEKIAQKFKTT